MRGKLVQQDPDDEPASELLKRIASEKEQLIKDKKIKKPKKLPNIKNDEIIGLLPCGWEFVRLNDLGEWGAGATPRRGASELYGGNIPWFKSGELVDDNISESEETVTELALKKASLRFNKAGDVLLAMYGATIGKTSILSVPATTNQAVCACTPFSGFSNIFLLTVLKAYKSRFIGMGVGGAQPNISREKIITTVIALPPEAEQPRIVAKVDELMALCDQLEQQTESSLDAHNLLVDTLLATLTDARDANELSDNWARLAEHFDTLITTDYAVEQLKQTILQLPVMGKLAPQDPNDEPASELLKRIAAEKEQLIKDKKIKKQKPLPEITDEDKPFELPCAWSWSRFGAIFKDLKYGTSQKSDYHFSGTPVLRIPNVVKGYVDSSDLKFSVLSDREIKDYSLEEGDILQIRSNGSSSIVGSTAVVDKEHIGFSYAGYLVRIRLIRALYNPNFLHLVLKSELCRSQIEQPLRTTSGVKNINSTEISNLILPCVPLREQRRIVVKIDQLMVLCDQLKARLSNVQTAKFHLADAVVEQALC